MTYFVTHQIMFRSGTETAPYRFARSFKSANGALRAGERHSVEMDKMYEVGSVLQHQIVVYDDQGRFVTNMAA